MFGKKDEIHLKGLAQLLDSLKQIRYQPQIIAPCVLKFTK